MIPKERPERSFVAKLPERGDDARSHQLDLPEQVRLAGRDLALERVAVLRRAALEDVREVDVATIEADAREQPPEQLTRLPREREPALILVEAGRFADEHQLRVGVARAEDDLRSRLGERAAHAARGLVRVRRESGGTHRGIHRASV